MNRTILFAALASVAVALPLDAQNRGGARPNVSNGRDAQGTSRRADGRDDVDGRDDRGRRDRDEDRDDDRDDDRDSNRRDDDGRVTRRFIDRNGLECVEKSVDKGGKRSYDLKCREPKKQKGVKGDKGDKGDKSTIWPPRTQDGRGSCVDANGDGRCDAGTGRGYPSTLPDMVGAVVFGQGERTDEVARWLGAGRYQVRYTDQDRDRRPERVRWLDSAGVVLQEWTDSDRDGRANIVNVYSAGRLVQSIGGR